MKIISYNLYLTAHTVIPASNKSVFSGNTQAKQVKETGKLNYGVNYSPLSPNSFPSHIPGLVKVHLAQSSISLT